MKKKLLILLAAVLLVAVSATAGAYAATKMKITVNGKSTSIQPKIINNVSYLPIRDMSNLLGIDINYIKSTNTIELSTENKNAMPDPIEAPSDEDASDIGQGEWLPNPEDIDAANRVFGLIYGLEDAMNSYHSNNSNATETKQAVADAKKNIYSYFAILNKSEIPQVKNYATTAEAALDAFEAGITSSSVIDNERIKAALQAFTKAHMELSKLIG
ncbi:stalk domain-containing protein [Paenibacillus sp. PL91]|uniref:stalk domain-containing protein n=1 Tax=Paenibacillus sp. PL91 TaxID=2729538 RepID=UPI00145E666C|nr:hypothetical protein [Paenibacillus sp. PL91]MBC9203729.1 hypothetical protein [Paenibacillus sp. PL91]